MISTGMILRKDGEGKLPFQEIVKKARAGDETGKLNCRGLNCRSILLYFIFKVKMTQIS